MEKTLGWTPIPIYDRAYEEELAAMQVLSVVNISISEWFYINISLTQVGFFSGICLPCYELMTKILPEVSPMLENCADNLTSWKALAEEKKKELENSSE